jgi:polyribonucleotide nucleotidyltransferase
MDQPQYGAVQIMKELVPRLIGPQGSTLTEIEEGCGASLIVDDGGTINVYAPTQVGTGCVLEQDEPACAKGI